MNYIDNRQNIVELTLELEKLFDKVVSHALNAEGVIIPCELSIILVDNHGIRELNKEYRNIDKATDVLSFPMLDFPKGKVFEEVYANKEIDISNFDGNELVLGDMVISLEKALEQSIEFDHSFIREVAYLTVHSVLHLLGYDHMEESDKTKMRSREEIILEELQIKRF